MDKCNKQLNLIILDLSFCSLSFLWVFWSSRWSIFFSRSSSWRLRISGSLFSYLKKFFVLAIIKQVVVELGWRPRRLSSTFSGPRWQKDKVHRFNFIFHVVSSEVLAKRLAPVCFCQSLMRLLRQRQLLIKVLQSGELFGLHIGEGILWNPMEHHCRRRCPQC